MLTVKEFQEKIAAGTRFLDGATGSNLRSAGMPRGCCTEEWILAHPEALVKLQRDYAKAGSQILYAPTFQAQPIALRKVLLDRQTETVNAHLVALTRSAAPGCLIAGDITTLAAFCETWDPDNFDRMVENYRVQIGGLLEGGADLLVGETLLYPQEAEAILTAAQKEGAHTVLFSFTMKPDGRLFSGHPAGDILRQLEDAGAAGVGFNCVAADGQTAALVSRLRRSVRGPLICKPNAGLPVTNSRGEAEYTMTGPDFADVQSACARMGATLLGGCCGTTPAHIAAMVKQLG